MRIRTAIGVAPAALAIALPGSALAARELPPPHPELPGYAKRMDGAVAAVAGADRGEAREEARQAGLELAEGLVRVEIFSAERAETVRLLERLGGESASTGPGIIEALVPPGALAELGRATDASRIAAPLESEDLARTGEGVALTDADASHAAGRTGEGVKVAVIDSGFAGYTASQASGDLPADAVAVNHCGAGNFDTGTSHGTSVAEIAHEMAPDAELHLICSNGSAALSSATDYAIATGVDVINHSVGYFNSSRGDGSGIAGTPDHSVARARDAGILWANASGNQAQRHWGGPYAPGAGSPALHDWAAGDELNAVTIGGGAEGCFFLKWDDWPTSDQDFDLLLYDSVGNLVGSSQDEQSGGVGHWPTEALCYTNPGSTAGFQVAVQRVSATTTPRLDLFAARSTSALERRVAATSLIEPASSPSALGVGAVCWVDESLRSYSSQGPTIDGRLKPELSAPDAVSLSDEESSGCDSGFTGTSAASPHVAGAAALLMQGSSAPVGEIQSRLEGAARDLGPSGADNGYGFGSLRVPLSGSGGSATSEPGAQPAPARPDLRFGELGNDTYSADPAGQSVRRRLKRGGSKRLALTLENDGQLAAEIRLGADHRIKRVRARYLLDGRDVTAALADGSLRRSLESGEAVELTVLLKPKRRAPSGRRSFEVLAEGGGTLDSASVRAKVR